MLPLGRDGEREPRRGRRDDTYEYLVCVRSTDTGTYKLVVSLNLGLTWLEPKTRRTETFPATDNKRVGRRRSSLPAPNVLDHRLALSRGAKAELAIVFTLYAGQPR